MRFKKLEIFLNLLFWAITSWFIVSTNSIEAQGLEIVDGEKVKTIIRSNDLIYLSLLGQLCFFLIFYAEIFLIQRLRKTKKIKGFILKTIGLLLFGLFWHELSVFLLFPTFDSFSTGVADVLIFYLAIALGYGFIKMWLLNEQDKKQLEFVKNQAELNLLKSQLQPHFLFNTMNNLLAMVNQRENPKLAHSIDKLSALLRYVVYDSKKEKVLVKDEMTFVENFAELNLLRFEEGEINFKIEINGVFDEQKIEPGIFLCYIENAFKHGVEPEKKSFIHINLDISKPNVVLFRIENSISLHSTSLQGGGFGMSSNKERLNLVYPNKHRIYSLRSETYQVELVIETDESNNS